jgi:hypothetical protein
MNLPPFLPAWLYLYFAFFGTLALALVAVIFWTWMRVNRIAVGTLRRALKWNIVGYFFVFCAAWFACGIGAGPGWLLSSDIRMHNSQLAIAAAASGMLASVLGWICLLIGQRRMLRALQEGM